MIGAAWAWAVGSKAGRTIGLILLGMLFILGMKARWESAAVRRDQQKAKEADHENADKIRDRVRQSQSVDRLREFEGRGFRDD